MWVPLLAELYSNPVRLLFGLGRYGVILSDSYRSEFFFHATHAHNAYLDLLIDAGLVVLVPFLVILVTQIKKSFNYGRKVKDPIFNSMLCALISYLVACISERAFFPHTDNMMLFPIIALMINILREYHSKQIVLKIKMEYGSNEFH